MYLKDRNENQEYVTYEFQGEKPEYLENARGWVVITIRKRDNMMEISNDGCAVTVHELLNCLRQVEEFKGERI